MSGMNGLAELLPNRKETASGEKADVKYRHELKYQITQLQ